MIRQSVVCTSRCVAAKLIARAEAPNEQASSERVRAKGDLSRHRTILQDAAGDPAAAGGRTP